MYNLFKSSSKFFVTKMPPGKLVIINLVVDILLRVLLFSIYGITREKGITVVDIICRAFQVKPPFRRIIHPEEVWLYKNPMTESYFPMNVLWHIVVVVPTVAIIANYMIFRDKNDVIQAFLAFSLTLSLNGAVTNVLKVIVGRPRPDFYYRCFPTGQGNLEMRDCTGDPQLINEGLRSFPSGHSSIAFASLGFLSLYMAGKMHLFTPNGKGSTIKLLAFIFPLFTATVIAISRTCDYHHHWQDVVVGSLLGFFICWLCYHNYYPPLTADKCHLPWVNSNSKFYMDPTNSVKEI